MKLSSKIILLTLVLLGFLAVNAILSWYEINKINREIKKIVKDDLSLMESSTLINEVQLKKKILFEKLASSAEELAFGNVNESRKEYLLDYVRSLKDEFQKDTLKVNELLNESINSSFIDGSLIEIFKTVQKSIDSYDRKVELIFSSVFAGTYQLSMEDLSQLSIEQGILSKDLQKSLAEVWEGVQVSVQRINHLQEKGKGILIVSLMISLVFGLILSLSIIQRIHSSLRTLLVGVRSLQHGNLGVHVPISTSDEIGELSNSFNLMSDQLRNYQEIMQMKNVELADTLKITQEQKSELEKINRDLDRFVHLISHDIYGPITAIISYGDYLNNRKEQFDPKIQDLIVHLNKVSHRLSSMVLDLLEMTTITRIKRPFEMINISTIVQEALQRQEFNIKKTGAEVHVLDAFPVLFVDRIKLTIVFYNLIGNAIKYSNKNGNKPQVYITCQKREKDYVFGIKDNGIGIDPQYFSILFTMFKRLPGSEDFQGTGVGLAVVKEIIQEHKGKLWVESTPNQGSQFFFTIPLES